MNFVLLWCLMLFIVVSVCNGNRRIIGGHNVTNPHPYIAYLLKAEVDPSGYIDWLCGGAIVGRRSILTSAACVQDVKHLYVIAGSLIHDKKGKESQQTCVHNSIRKVVHICVPKAYDLVYEELDKWANYDIALVKIDQDIFSIEYCDFKPQIIDINFHDESLQAVDTEVMILGWGHKHRWGNEDEIKDGNANYLRYGATLIYDKESCIQKYKSLGMDAVISKYMICTWGKAFFDDTGDTIDNQNGAGKDGCNDNGSGSDNESSDGGGSAQGPRESQEVLSGPKKNKKKKKSGKEASQSAEVGICQNDHGGPLISWKRSKTVVIGVASVFQMKETFCHGPYLYTSTYCSSAFLKCVIDNFESPPGHPRRRSMPDYCYLPAKEKGFEIIERRISWLTFQNKTEEKTDQKFYLRPQKPLPVSRL